MEKHDKIAHRQGQTRSRLAMALAGVMVVAVVVVTTRQQHPENGITTTQPILVEGKTLRHNNNNAESRVLQKKVDTNDSLQQLEEDFRAVEKEVREIKATGVIMEKDSKSLEATGRLQVASRTLCQARYGSLEPYHIRVDAEFQVPGLSESDRHASFVIETAPLKLIPYSVYNFLQVARGYQSGGFHRKAGHVLQVSVKSTLAKQPLAFQEYSPEYPHAKRTTGYCGRPSGHAGCWYMSTMDNTRNHGPGSQQTKNPYEADANFGRIIEGYEEIEPRIRAALPKDGFIGDPNKWVLIRSMTILVPDGNGGYTEWKDVHESDSLSAAAV